MAIERLRAMFADEPSVTCKQLGALQNAALELETDPEFQADYTKSLFVTLIRSAMDRAGMNQTMVASKWGRSRQYLNKVLNEDKRVNFTFETAVELAMIVRKKFTFTLEDMDEPKYTLRYNKMTSLDCGKSVFVEANLYGEAVASIPLGDRTTQEFISQNYEQTGTISKPNESTCELPA